MTTYQVEAEEQRAQGRDEQDVDKVARQVGEPRAGAHGGGDASTEAMGCRGEGLGRDEVRWN